VLRVNSLLCRVINKRFVTVHSSRVAVMRDKGMISSHKEASFVAGNVGINGGYTNENMHPVVVFLGDDYK
jgi:hypothetical protein